MERDKKQKLEDELESYALIIEKPLTADLRTYIQAICHFDALQLEYIKKYQKEYLPKSIRNLLN